MDNYENKIDELRGLSECISRAINRNDLDQMHLYQTSICEFWKNTPDLSNDGYCRGYSDALNMTLDWAICRWRGNAVWMLLSDNSLELRILHIIGKMTREASQKYKDENFEFYSLNDEQEYLKYKKFIKNYFIKFSLLTMIIDKSQEELQISLDKMHELQIVCYNDTKSAVKITDDGMNILEAKLPGWQITKVL